MFLEIKTAGKRKYYALAGMLGGGLFGLLVFLYLYMAYQAEMERRSSGEPFAMTTNSRLLSDPGGIIECMLWMVGMGVLSVLYTFVLHAITYRKKFSRNN